MKVLIIPILSFICLGACNPESSIDNIYELQMTLDTIYHRDQYHRKLLKELVSTNTATNIELDKLNKEIAFNDSLNRVFIANLLTKNGWPDKASLSNTGHKTIFLIIQHSEYDFQKEYFEYVKKAYEQGIIQGRQMAMLIDRMSLDKTGFQYYGTQLKMDDSTKLFSLFPLKDPLHVDSLRATMGLDSLHNYLSLWNTKKIN